MKVLGFVVIILGILSVYIGVTGSQHRVMGILTNNPNPTPAGLSINPAGYGSGSTAAVTSAGNNKATGSGYNNVTAV